MKNGLRFALILSLAMGLALMLKSDAALAASVPAVSLSVSNAGPRQVEDTTERAVARDYALAWQTMASALEQNRSDLLGANFIGAANEKLAATISQQHKAGLHQRIIDKGHTVDAVFYSPEGSAMELHDTARLEVQVLDGDKVVQSEDATVHYVALLTAAESSWKVRLLEATPSF